MQFTIGLERGLTRFYRVLMYKDIWLYLCAALSVYLLGAVPFDRVLREDAYNFVVKGMEIAHGDFSLDRAQVIGWPLMLGSIFSFLDVSDVFEAMFVARWTAIAIFALCVFVLGRICLRLFGREGYHGLVIAIVLAFMFAYRTGDAARSALAESLIVLCTLVVTWLLLKACTTDRIRLGYAALSAAVSGIAYYVRPYGLFLFAALLLVILLVSRKHRRRMVTAGLVAIGVFVIVTLPDLYARYISFGSPLDYGSNSKYFVDHYEHVWADNVAAPSLWQYLTSHDWGQYYHKFIREGILVVLYYLWIGLLPVAWIALSIAGAVSIFRSGRRALYFAPLAVLVSVAGMTIVFHIYGSIRHLIYLVPLLLITAGAFFFVLDRARFDIKNIAGTFMIAFVLATVPGIYGLHPDRIEIPEVKDLLSALTLTCSRCWQRRRWCSHQSQQACISWNRLLHDGRWGDQQFIPDGWIESFASTPYYPNLRSRVDGYFGDNYPKDMFKVFGSGGNFALVLPICNLIGIGPVCQQVLYGRIGAGLST